MKPLKALGLAAVAAMTAMAFIGTNSAFAEDEVVICKELAQKLCPEGKLWPQGSVIFALAQNPILKTNNNNIKCEDSILEAKTSATIGSPLSLEILSFDFGKLPTPKLGQGCTGCPSGIHPSIPFPSEIKVTEKDEFFFNMSGGFSYLKCLLLEMTCSYAGENIESAIEHNGTHPNDPEAGNLPLILVRAILLRQEGSSVFCPKEFEWQGNYAVYRVYWMNSETFEEGLGWPALDVK